MTTTFRSPVFPTGPSGQLGAQLEYLFSKHRPWISEVDRQLERWRDLFSQGLVPVVLLVSNDRVVLGITYVTGPLEGQVMWSRQSMRDDNDFFRYGNNGLLLLEPNRSPLAIDAPCVKALSPGETDLDRDALSSSSLSHDVVPKIDGCLFNVYVFPATTDNLLYIGDASRRLGYAMEKLGMKGTFLVSSKSTTVLNQFMENALERIKFPQFLKALLSDPAVVALPGDVLAISFELLTSMNGIAQHVFAFSDLIHINGISSEAGTVSQPHLQNLVSRLLDSSNEEERVVVQRTLLSSSVAKVAFPPELSSSASLMDGREMLDRLVWIAEPELFFRVHHDIVRIIQAGGLLRFSDTPADALLTLQLLSEEGYLIDRRLKKKYTEYVQQIQRVFNREVSSRALDAARVTLAYIVATFADPESVPRDQIEAIDPCDDLSTLRNRFARDDRLSEVFLDAVGRYYFSRGATTEHLDSIKLARSLPGKRQLERDLVNVVCPAQLLNAPEKYLEGGLPMQKFLEQIVPGTLLPILERIYHAIAQLCLMETRGIAGVVSIILDITDLKKDDGKKTKSQKKSHGKQTTQETFAAFLKYQRDQIKERFLKRFQSFDTSISAESLEVLKVVGQTLYASLWQNPVVALHFLECLFQALDSNENLLLTDSLDQIFLATCGWGKETNIWRKVLQNQKTPFQQPDLDISSFQASLLQYLSNWVKNQRDRDEFFNRSVDSTLPLGIHDVVKYSPCNGTAIQGIHDAQSPINKLFTGFMQRALRIFGARCAHLSRALAAAFVFCPRFLLLLSEPVPTATDLVLSPSVTSSSSALTTGLEEMFEKSLDRLIGKGLSPSGIQFIFADTDGSIVDTSDFKGSWQSRLGKRTPVANAISSWLLKEKGNDKSSRIFVGFSSHPCDNQKFTELLCSFIPGLDVSRNFAGAFCPSLDQECDAVEWKVNLFKMLTQKIRNRFSSNPETFPQILVLDDSRDVISRGAQVGTEIGCFAQVDSEGFVPRKVPLIGEYLDERVWFIPGRFILMGLPASGKTTFSKRVEQQLPTYGDHTFWARSFNHDQGNLATQDGLLEENDRWNKSLRNAFSTNSEVSGGLYLSDATNIDFERKPPSFQPEYTEVLVFVPRECLSAATPPFRRFTPREIAPHLPQICKALKDCREPWLDLLVARVTERKGSCSSSFTPHLVGKGFRSILSGMMDKLLGKFSVNSKGEIADAVLAKYGVVFIPIDWKEQEVDSYLNFLIEETQFLDTPQVPYDGPNVLSAELRFTLADTTRTSHLHTTVCYNPSNDAIAQMLPKLGRRGPLFIENRSRYAITKRTPTGDKELEIQPFILTDPASSSQWSGLPFSERGQKAPHASLVHDLFWTLQGGWTRTPPGISPHVKAGPPALNYDHALRERGALKEEALTQHSVEATLVLRTYPQTLL